MNFKNILQEAADTGRRQKLEDEHVVTIERAAQEQRDLAEQAKLTAAAIETLKTMPARMQEAARNGEPLCAATCVPIVEVGEQIDYSAGCSLNPANLRGASQRIFTILQEMGLKPVLNALPHNIYVIQVPVLPPRGSSAG